MGKRKNNRYIAALILGVLVGFFWRAALIGVILICLKAAGVITLSWALVLRRTVWLAWAVYALTVLVNTIVYLRRRIKHGSRL